MLSQTCWVLVQHSGKQAQLEMRLTIIERFGGSIEGWMCSIYPAEGSTVSFYLSLPQGKEKGSRPLWLPAIVTGGGFWAVCRRWMGNCYVSPPCLKNLACVVILQLKLPPSHIHHQLGDHLVVSASLWQPRLGHGASTLRVSGLMCQSSAWT